MRRVIVVALALVALAACGIPSDGAPRQIADEKVPFGLLGPSTTTPGNSVPGGQPVRLYFLDASHRGVLGPGAAGKRAAGHVHNEGRLPGRRSRRSR